MPPLSTGCFFPLTPPPLLRLNTTTIIIIIITIHPGYSFFPLFFTRTHISFYPRLLNNTCTCVCRHHNDKPDRPEDLRAVSPRDVTERVIILMIILLWTRLPIPPPLTPPPSEKNGWVNNDVHHQGGNMKIPRKSVHRNTELVTGNRQNISDSWGHTTNIRQTSSRN